MVMGRPPIPFNPKLFEDLCYIHCTLEEIAGVMRCSPDTVENRVKEHYGQTFSEVFKEKSAMGKMSLRRVMWNKAIEKQDNTMLIWLSKNQLGMSDRHEERVIQEKPTEVKIVWQTPQREEIFYDQKQAQITDESPTPEDDGFLPPVEVPV